MTSLDDQIRDFFDERVSDDQLIARIEDPCSFILRLRQFMGEVLSLDSEAGRRFLIMRFIVESAPQASRRVRFTTILEAIKFLDRKGQAVSDRLINISPIEIDAIAQAALPAPEEKDRQNTDGPNRAD